MVRLGIDVVDGYIATEAGRAEVVLSFSTEVTSASVCVHSSSVVDSQGGLEVVQQLQQSIILNNKAQQSLTEQLPIPGSVAATQAVEVYSKL